MRSSAAAKIDTTDPTGTICITRTGWFNIPTFPIVPIKAPPSGGAFLYAPIAPKISIVSIVWAPYSGRAAGSPTGGRERAETFGRRPAAGGDLRPAPAGSGRRPSAGSGPGAGRERAGSGRRPSAGSPTGGRERAETFGRRPAGSGRIADGRPGAGRERAGSGPGAGRERAETFGRRPAGSPTAGRERADRRRAAGSGPKVASGQQGEPPDRGAGAGLYTMEPPRCGDGMVKITPAQWVGGLT